MLLLTYWNLNFIGRRLGATQSGYIKRHPAGHHPWTGQKGKFSEIFFFFIDVMSSAFTFCN